MLENLISNNLNFLYFLFSYLIGSIPFGYIFFRIIKKGDIRKFGSGNIGATNVNRLVGKKYGTLTLFLDFLKAFITCLFIHIYLGTEIGLICGILVIVGHIFPIWLKFKGGKGVASFIGFMLVTSWPLCVIFLIMWALIVKICKYSSLGAIFSIIMNIIAFKFILYLQFKYGILLWVPGDPIEFQFTFFISIIILLKHHKNIVNIIKEKLLA